MTSGRGRKTAMAAARKRFKAEQAAHLARQIGGPTTPAPKPVGSRLSEAMTFYADKSQMVVVVGTEEDQDTVDLALVYGLRHAGPRPLSLLLPEGKEAATLGRATWLSPLITIWSHENARVQLCPLPSKEERLGAYTDELEVGTLNLAGREPWVRELLDWADSETHLSRIARRQYVAWHCLGRQVLKVELTRSGLRVTSGVDYSKPALDKPPAVTLDVSVSLQAGDLQRVKTAAQAAVERRLAGHDKDNEEHRLQHALEAHKYLLGLERIEREFAAWRPLRRAFIDFLGVDRARCLHIIETKIGPDPMLGLQGLDYWVWARAHERSLAAHFQASEFSSIVVDFVVGPKPRKTSLVDQYAISTVEALSEEVDWRFHRIDHWREHPTLSSLGLRQMPDRQGRGSRPQR